ncbi:family 78 glycoside hydrolase catalytic domain [Streptomyces sp. NPDC003247]|uniref:family 78 glycoside hydrolase catalytic domain n=1 Tax=Streptomyces sp. NPDC003247 TaxID=3364677 RepID=UPI00368DA1C5
MHTSQEPAELSAALIPVPEAPRIEHATGPGRVIVTSATPRLSWTVGEALASYVQEGYEIEVERQGAIESFRFEGAGQTLVRWPASALRSREPFGVRVRVRGEAGWGQWGPSAYGERGLADTSDWSARLISPRDIGRSGGPAPLLGARIVLPENPANARLYITSRGVFVPFVNGRRAGDLELAPGWTSYHHRLRYHVLDVTSLLKRGENTLSVLLGDGWYRGRLGVDGRALYGERLALLAQLEVTLEDGTRIVLASDDSWRACDSEILSADLYDGQVTDLRGRAEDGTAFVHPVDVLDLDLGTLVPEEGGPVRATQVVPARRLWTSEAGSTLVDFGQNLTGRLRIRHGDRRENTTVTVRHAEVLENGELAVRPLRTARATDVFHLPPGPAGELEPSLTFHGFRYARIDGLPDVSAADVDAVVLGSDLPRTGWFSCSHPLLEQLHENIVWSTRGNFLSIPTDCPQRDERLGWTGDIQVFAPAALFLFDCAAFLSSWLRDLSAEQLSDGSVPLVVPDIWGDTTPAAGWGDAAVVVPWTLYQRTGDAEILRRQFPSMRGWVERVLALAGPGRLWEGGFQFGDWLDPSAPADNPLRAQTPPEVVATAYLAYSVRLLAESAAVIGLSEEAERYERIAAEVRRAFRHAYVTPDGRVIGESQTAYAMAIMWDLFDDALLVEAAGRRLADRVRASGFRIATGFLGTPLVADALTRTGNVDVAYRLLLQTECPSWLYPVTQGATTIWERWDSLLPDGSVNPGEMTSFNHYALGAIADWLHRTVAGLAPAAPGYRRILVEPRPSAELTHATACHRTPYGAASVAWRRASGVLHVAVTVPVGTEAEVRLPGNDRAVTVGHGSHTWQLPDPVTAPAALPAPTTVRDVLDRPGLWDGVVDLVADLTGGTPDEPGVAAQLAPWFDAPAHELTDALGARGAIDIHPLREGVDRLLGSSHEGTAQPFAVPPVSTRSRERALQGESK